MPDEAITIEVDAEALQRALERAPNELRRQLSQAGREAAQTILKETGLRSYPKMSYEQRAKRMMGHSYYARGRGYVSSRGNHRYNSERLGSQWNVRTTRDYKTVIGNRASYAKYVHGEEQNSQINKNIPGQGWQKLKEVAVSKVQRITRIYESWIERALMRAGLK